MQHCFGSHMVITRKPHRCWGCGRRFWKGAHLEVVEGVNDGQFWRCYYCSICRETMSHWHWNDLECIDYGDVKWNDERAWEEAEQVVKERRLKGSG